MKANTKRLTTAIMLLVIMALTAGTMVSARAGAASAPVQRQTEGNIQVASPGALLPGALLPGDAAPAPAAYNQDKPQIARGANGYLVVWEDSRTNYNNLIDGAPQGGYEGTQLLKDIYAARLDASGQLLDHAPIVVSQAIWNQTRPQVAWNGQGWLVVWNSERLAGTTTTIDVMAARVSPGGVLLDSTPIVVDSDPTINELFPTVASDGSNWVVVWMDGWNDGRLNAARISPAGTLLDPAGASIVIANFPDIPYNPSVTFAGDEYLVVWDANNKIKGLRFSPALEAIGAPFQVAPAGIFPSVATNGTDFLVSWKLGASVVMGRVTHAGQTLDPNGVDVSASNGGSPRPGTAWDGTRWFVTWTASLGTSYAARISTDGTVLDPGGIAIAASTRASAIAGLAGGGALVVWTDYSLNGLGSTDIFSASVSGGGTVGPAAGVSFGAPSQVRPDIAGNGTSYLAVFASNVSGETRIKGQRLDATGSAIDAEPFLIMGGAQTLVRPRVAWNGSLYLVVWEDSSVNRGFVRGAIFGKRVSAQGIVLDANPTEIMPGNTPDVSALGSTFLVVDTYEQVNHIRFPMAVRVDNSGSVLGSPTSIGSNYALLPRVATLGSRWLAVWQATATHDANHVFVYAAFVNAGGVGAGEFLVAGLNGFSVKVPDVAAGPDQALISYFNTASDYQENGDIFARRITADGTLLDSDPGLQVTSADRAQFVPSGAWDGSEYVVAYEDYRNTTFLDRPVSDVYATRVDINGAVLDPDGVAIGNEFTPEVNPVVASNGGSYLIGTANFKSAQPFGAYRIAVQYGAAGSPPTPQATHTPGATPTVAATPTVTAAIPTSTSTPGTAATSTPVAATSTGTAVSSTSTRTSTPGATATAGAPTGTPAQATSTAVSTATTAVATTTATVTVTVTACTIEFSDVPAGSTFYAYIKCLACKGIINGYADGTFRPGSGVTRGQLSKVVSNAAGYSDTPTTQTFTDVPAGSTFYLYIERLAMRGIIGGYPDGTFRPDGGATRGQISKIISNAAGYNDTPTTQTFEDIPATHTFYVYIERLAMRGIMAGYSCGGAGEPCNPGNRPYFRSSANATRGQLAKLVSNTFFPSCASSQRP